MTRDPGAPFVLRAARFDEEVARTFGAERSADGTRPSRSDFEHSCWPSLLSALSTSWRSAVCVGDDLPEVFALPIQPHHGMFPPARVVFVKEPMHLQDPKHLIVIGLDFDWDHEWPEDE